jgi:hypothetical protein
MKVFAKQAQFNMLADRGNDLNSPPSSSFQLPGTGQVDEHPWEAVAILGCGGASAAHCAYPIRKEHDKSKSMRRDDT